MLPGFFMLDRERLLSVQNGTVSDREFGLFCLLALLSNPYNGFWFGNFSSFANELNIDHEEARYILNKLKKLGWIYFQMSQGQKKCHFFVMKFAMSTPKGQPHRIVTPEYISHILDDSEVKSHFPKLESQQCIATMSEKKVGNSEVPYKEKEKEIEKEMEIYSHLLFKGITQEDWVLLKAKYDIPWLETRLRSYSERLTKTVSFDLLKTFLDEDWLKKKPVKNYARDDAEQRKKIREWEAVQKAEEDQPPPPELLEYRKQHSSHKSVPS